MNNKQKEAINQHLQELLKDPYSTQAIKEIEFLTILAHVLIEQAKNEKPELSPFQEWKKEARLDLIYPEYHQNCYRTAWNAALKWFEINLSLIGEEPLRSNLLNILNEGKEE